MDSLSLSQEIENRIYLIRGQRVMLDVDLTEKYSVSTERLNEQVRRNRNRFPSDFMFQLSPLEAAALRSQFATSNEAASLRSQIVTSNKGRGGRRYLPYAFTEHGAVMLAGVLKPPIAVQVICRWRFP